jgi:hypothetical protein
MHLNICLHIPLGDIEMENTDEMFSNLSLYLFHFSAIYVIKI